MSHTRRHVQANPSVGAKIHSGVAHQKWAPEMPVTVRPDALVVSVAQDGEPGEPFMVGSLGDLYLDQVQSKWVDLEERSAGVRFPRSTAFLFPIGNNASSEGAKEGSYLAPHSHHLQHDRRLTK